jgi:hypothetical protein
MNTQTQNTPVAPTVGAQGSRKPGGHYQAYKAQPAFAPTATLRLISGSNPWRPNCPGYDFYVQVLSQSPATVQAAIDMAAKAKTPQKAAEVQKHLRWLYTWGGSYLEVDGKLANLPAPAPRAPRKVSGKAKAQAKA